MKRMRGMLACALAAAVLASLSCLAAAEPGEALQKLESVARAPGVTLEMCEAAHWLEKKEGVGERLLTQEQIEAFNRSLYAVEGTHTRDLSEFEGTFDGVALVEERASFESPEGLYLNGEPVPESYYEAIRENIRGASVTEEMPYRYGFAVNRTIMKDYPYEDFLSDDPSNPEWDELNATGILVNEPLVLLFATADEKFTLVYSPSYIGWAPTEDIAVCASKEEWERFRNPEEFLVVTGEKLYLEPSVDPDLNEKLLTMGTRLPLVTDYDESVANRKPWYNFVVQLPARDSEGRFYPKNALISANRDVSVGCLPYTWENVLAQAFKSLGDRYGWGGMMHGQDCSSFVREVYLCFGLELARNTSWQAAMPADVTLMADMTPEEKMAALDALPAGTILILPGHEMLYLGSEDGRYYVINDSSASMSIIINDLASFTRSNGKSWLENLSHAVVIH